MASSQSSSPFGGGGKGSAKSVQLQLEDTRLPAHPYTTPTLLRLLFIVLNLIYAFRGHILPRAAQYRPGAPPQVPEPEGVWGFLDTLIAIPAQGLFFLLSPPVLGYFEWALLAVWLMLLLELCFAALLTAGQAPPRRASLQHFRIRAPGPFTSAPGQGTSAPVEELFRGLHGAISGATSQFTTISLLLTGRKDRGTRLSTAVRGDVTRQTWLDMLRSALRRQEDGIIIDKTDDPLIQAVREAGKNAPAWVATCELVPRLGPHYPLRLGSEEGETLLSLLTTAMSPRTGVHTVECQVIIQPRDPRQERFKAWRILAERRLKRMRSKQLFQISADGKLLEEKLEDPSLFAVTIRLVAVAKTQTAAQIALDPIIGAFGQYTTQSVRGDVQQLKPKHKKFFPVKPSELERKPNILLMLLAPILLLAGLAVGAGGTLLLHDASLISTGLALFGAGLV